MDDRVVSIVPIGQRQRSQVEQVVAAAASVLWVAVDEQFPAVRTRLEFVDPQIEVEMRDGIERGGVDHLYFWCAARRQDDFSSILCAEASCR